MEKFKSYSFIIIGSVKLKKEHELKFKSYSFIIIGSVKLKKEHELKVQLDLKGVYLILFWLSFFNCKMRSL